MEQLLDPGLACFKYYKDNLYINYHDFALRGDETLNSFKRFYFTFFPALLFWYYPDRTESGDMFLSAQIVPGHHNIYGEVIKERAFTYCRSICYDDKCDFKNTPYCNKAHYRIGDHNSSVTNILPFGSRICPFYSVYDTEYLYLNPTEQYFFSVSAFYTALIPQIISRTLGSTAREDFYKASSWPKMSAGLGGFVSAEQWIKESKDLLPLPQECIYYNALLDNTLPFFSNEVADFLKGGQASANLLSYKDLAKIASDRIDTVLNELKSAVENAKMNFKTGNIPVYYLSFEEQA